MTFPNPPKPSNITHIPQSQTGTKNQGKSRKRESEDEEVETRTIPNKSLQEEGELSSSRLSEPVVRSRRKHR